MTRPTPVSVPRGIVAGAVALWLLVSLVVGVTPDVAAQPGPPTLGLVDRSPWVDVDGTLTVDLAVDDSVDSVDIRVHGRLDSPDELADSRTEDEGPVLFVGSFPVEDLTPVTDGVRRLQLDVSATLNEGSTVRMAFAGVYPMVITPVTEGVAGEPIRTPVVRRADDVTELASPTIALAVDLSTGPTATATGDRRTFRTDELARFGRLAELLARSVPDRAPVTVLASADTIAGLAVSGAEEATALLDSLDMPGVTVVAQPTVPLDWTALAAAGLDDLIPDLVADGRDTLTAAADPVIDPDTWDARGGIDVATLDAVAAAGYDTVLVASTLLRLDDEASDPAVTTPMTVGVEGAPPGLDVLAVDDATSETLMSPVDGPDTAHDVLADLVLRAPDPDTPMLTVVDDVPDGSALETVFDLLATSGSPVPLMPLNAASEAQPEPPSVTLLPPAGSQIEDLSALAGRIRTAAATVATYSETVGDDAPATERARALLAGSVQRGLPRSERERRLDGIDALTSSTFDGLGFTGPSSLNLTSRSGTLPIGIRNDSDAVVTVVLSARSDRLRFPDGDAQAGLVGREEVAITLELAPGETRIDLAVEALASGSVPLFVQLRSPDGATTFDSRQLNVRSTAVSGVGLILSGGALVVLLAWWFRTWRARRRAGPGAAGSDEAP